MIYLDMNNGGMGNQMFQYAVARKLQNKYGQYVICDLRKFSYRKTNATKRGFCLDEFCISQGFIFKHSIILLMICKIKYKALSYRYRNKEKRTRQIALMKAGIYVPEGYFDWFEEQDTKAKVIYVNGLFQSYRYFDDIRDLLIDEFKIKKTLNKGIRSILERIRSENAVCIHWRRGDYLEPMYKMLQVCDDAYYLKAIDHILKNIRDPVFYIFTNTKSDALYLKNNIRFPVEVNFVNLIEQEIGSDMEDFILMCNCKHYILSNSTYSWWAQYLNVSDKKIVCAPESWINGEHITALHMPDWVVIK